MKNIFIAGILLLTSASYAQITISQEKNIADAMELKKEIARTESAFQVQIYNGNITEANTNNTLYCSLSSRLTTKCALVVSVRV